MKFQFPSEMWEIEILFLIEESFKTFAYFLYNLRPLFHLKVSKISFSNSRLFPHVDDLLLQETLFELVEHWLGVGVGKHVELHLPVRRAVIATHHAVEVLTSAEGLGHALCHWLNVVVGCAGVCCRVPVPLQIPLPFGSTPTISSLIFTFIFFSSFKYS